MSMLTTNRPTRVPTYLINSSTNFTRKPYEEPHKETPF